MDRVKSFHVGVGDDRSIRVYMHNAEMYCIANGLCSAFVTSDGGFRVSFRVSCAPRTLTYSKSFLSKHGIVTMKHDALKGLLGLKGKIRFLNRAGMIALLRHRLTGDVLAGALRALDTERSATLALAAPEEQEAESDGEADADKVEAESHMEAAAARKRETDGKLEADAHEEQEADGQLEPESNGEVDADGEWEADCQSEADADDELEAEPDLEAEADGEWSAESEGGGPEADTVPRLLRTLSRPVKRNKFLNLTIANEDGVKHGALDMSSRYTESSERKMQMAFRAYSQVCTARKWDPLAKALPDERLLQFVYLCLHKDYKIQYGLESFRDVYVPALFRYFDREGYTYSAGVRERIRNKIHSMVTHSELAPEQIPKERGAEPICTWDLEYIASVYPKGCRDRAQVMAWMSVGLHTGVRGVSLESAVWEDTKVVQPSEQVPHFKQLTLVFRATKGDPNWHHPVTIEGSTLNGSGSDPVYWLNHLLKQHLNDAEAELTQTTVALLRGQVFAASETAPVAKATMSARIEAIGRYCGYPERMLTNHGLRAGFLCTALLKHAVNPEEEVHFSGVWTKCALVAGWTVNSKHMERYCKQAFLRCIVSSRLIMGGTLEPGTDEIVARIAGVGAVAKNRLTPCHFHGLEALVPCWPESTKSQIWVDKFNECIRSTLAKERPEFEARVLGGAEAYVSNNACLQLAKSLGLYERKKGVAMATASKFARECVKDWIVTKFESESEPWWVDSFLANQVQPIVTTLAFAYDFDEERSQVMQKIAKRKNKKRQESPTHEEDRNDSVAIAPTKRAKVVTPMRVAWTLSETAALCQGVIRYSGAKWAEISKSAQLQRRNNVQCKDRMRVLMKHYQSTDMLQVAEQWMEGNQNE